MPAKADAPPIVHPPAAAAARLGITVAGLVAIIRRNRAEFSELAHGGKPGDKGRNRWGLTDAQLAAIVKQLARKLPEPEPEPEAPPSAVSPDGKRRMRSGPSKNPLARR